MTQGGIAGRSTTAGFGDSRGVETRRAFSSTSCGGRERGEIMIPGAEDGFVGHRLGDQIARQTVLLNPSTCFAFLWT
jgi:hypothetical protein